MEFDREALLGIFDALPEYERGTVHQRAVVMGILNHPKFSIERNCIMRDVLIELGYIMTFDVPNTETAAQEYDEIMQAQELMK